MKTTILIKVRKADWDALGDGKPAKLREGIKAVTEHPEVLGQVVSQVLVEEAEEGEEKQTTVSVDPDDIKLLDTLAKKIESTRRALIQLVIKGILAGVIR